MTRFRNTIEQKDFIKDSNELHQFMLELIPVEKRDLVIHIGNSYLTKWKNIFEIDSSEIDIKHMFRNEQKKV